MNQGNGAANLAAVLAERLEQRQQRARWKADPVAWVQERLGEHVWSKQAEVMRSVATKPLTAVQSCHGLGKSHLASRLIAWYIDVHEPGDVFVVTCFTDDTEILTKDGWKKFQDVKTGPDGDLFATRNQATKRLEWQHATRYYEAPWDGEVVDVKARSLHMRVTPNHRMLVKWSDYRRGTSGEILKPAEKITRRGATIPMTSEWHTDPAPSMQFGRYEWDSVTFASFLGAWLAEGSTGPARRYTRRPDGRKGRDREGVSTYGGAITITQLPGTKGYEPYRELLTKMIGSEPCRSQDKNWTFHCSDLWHYLRELGKARTKYIPDEVKNWGRPELEALLHYYLLGDGWSHKSPDGSLLWRCTTVSKRLADDLQEIAQKVGIWATIKLREPRSGGTFEGGRTISAENCAPGYYLSFNKSECRTVQVDRSHYSGNVYCVSVPNEVIYVRRNGSPIWCGNTAPTSAQVRAILWRYIRQVHTRGGLRGDVMQTAEWKIDGELVGMGRKPNSYDDAAFQGLHAPVGVLVVIDEASGVDEALWNAADALVTTPQSRILAVGNPDVAGSHFQRVCTVEPGWSRFKISAFDTPAFTGEPVPAALANALVSREWVEDKRLRWGESNPLYRAKVLAEFADGEDSLIPLSWVTAANQRWNDWNDSGRPSQPGSLILGVDVARYGEDSTCLAHRYGDVIAQIDQYDKLDTTQTTELVRAALYMKVKPVAVVDVIGVGAGVVDQCRSLRLPVVAFNASEGTRRRDATGAWKFNSTRSAAWWHMRELLDPANGSTVALPPDDELTAELTIPRWDIRAGGILVVEGKDGIRKRLGRSTDSADAVIMAFWHGKTPIPADPTNPRRSRVHKHRGSDTWE